jgi:hypothetical protein
MIFIHVIIMGHAPRDTLSSETVYADRGLLFSVLIQVLRQNIDFPGGGAR